MKYFLIFIFGMMGYSAGAQNNPVVVELFTSQGCSSCPAADQSLKEILRKAEKEGNPVYGLSFHVDYWNYIGWKDPYSREQYTERQRNYAAAMGLRSIYTPQMIVNGEVEFVGSSRKVAEETIAEALTHPSKYQLEIKEMKVTGDKIQIAYTVNPSPGNEILNVALVEKEVKNYVARGENSGRHLEHVQVVRYFQTVQLKRQAELSLPLPEHTASLSVVLYVAEGHQKVKGAIRRELK